jgi:hypothetical protein
MQSLRRACRRLDDSLRQFSAWTHSDNGIAQARTPPAEWYTSEKIRCVDGEHVFSSGWRLADVHALPKASYRAGRMPGVEYLLTNDEAGNVLAFHNVGFRPPLCSPPQCLCL